MKMRMLRWMPAALGLLVLPACPLADWFKEWFGYKTPYTQTDMKSNSGKQEATRSQAVSDEPAIVLQDGDGVIPRSQFEEHVNAVFQSQPGIEQYLQMMGRDQVKAMYEQIANMLRDQYVMRQFVEQNELDQTADYQKNRKMLIDQVENQLANYAFSQHLWDQLGDISDKEARSYYKQNQDKEMFQREPFIQESGGIKAVAVKADSQAQAENIASKAKESDDLKKAARDYDKADAFQELGTVSQQDTKPSRSVVAKVHRMQDLPAVDTVTAEDGVYVVRAIEKVSPTYADFEEVKQSVKDVIKNQNFQNKYQKKLDELRNQYNIRVNDEVIDSFVEQTTGGAQEE